MVFGTVNNLVTMLWDLCPIKDCHLAVPAEEDFLVQEHDFPTLLPNSVSLNVALCGNLQFQGGQQADAGFPSSSTGRCWSRSKNRHRASYFFQSQTAIFRVVDE